MRVLNRPIYEALVTSYREAPEDHAAAAKAAGMDIRTARRTWDRGWPNLKLKAPWAIPIRDVLAATQVQARVKLAEEEAARKHRANAAADDAASQMADEVNAVRNVSVAANALLALAATVFPAMRTIAEQIVKDAGKFAGDPALALHVLHRFTTTVGAAVAVAERALAMERLRIGKPAAVLGLNGIPDTSDMSMEDYERELAAATRAMERARELGLFAPAS
jgi:hypothetical protein